MFERERPFPAYCPPTAESFGVSAQIGPGVVRGGPEVRFHKGSTRVPPGFYEGSTRFCEGRAPHAVGSLFLHFLFRIYWNLIRK